MHEGWPHHHYEELQHRHQYAPCCSHTFLLFTFWPTTVVSYRQHVFFLFFSGPLWQGESSNLTHMPFHGRGGSQRELITVRSQHYAHSAGSRRELTARAHSAHNTTLDKDATLRSQHDDAGGGARASCRVRSERRACYSTPLRTRHSRLALPLH